MAPGADTFEVKAIVLTSGFRFDGNQKAVIKDFAPTKRLRDSVTGEVLLDPDTGEARTIPNDKIILPGAFDAYSDRYDARADVTLISYVENEVGDVSVSLPISFGGSVEVETQDSEILIIHGNHVLSDPGFIFTTS